MSYHQIILSHILKIAESGAVLLHVSSPSHHPCYSLSSPFPNPTISPLLEPCYLYKKKKPVRIFPTCSVVLSIDEPYVRLLALRRSVDEFVDSKVEEGKGRRENRRGEERKGKGREGFGLRICSTEFEGLIPLTWICSSRRWFKVR